MNGFTFAPIDRFRSACRPDGADPPTSRVADPRSLPPRRCGVRGGNGSSNKLRALSRRSILRGGEMRSRSGDDIAVVDVDFRGVGVASEESHANEAFGVPISTFGVRGEGVERVGGVFASISNEDSNVGVSSSSKTSFIDTSDRNRRVADIGTCSGDEKTAKTFPAIRASCSKRTNQRSRRRRIAMT